MFWKNAKAIIFKLTLTIKEVKYIASSLYTVSFLKKLLLHSQQT